MFTDVFFTPVLVNDLIDLALDLAAVRAIGVFHIAGAERLSKHEFALRLAGRFGLSSAGVTASSVEGFAFKARRPNDMSLSCRKVEQCLGRSMPTLDEGLDRLLTLEHQGWPERMNRAVGGATRTRV